MSAPNKDPKPTPIRDANRRKRIRLSLIIWLVAVAIFAFESFDINAVLENRRGIYFLAYVLIGWIPYAISAYGDWRKRHRKV